MTTLTASPTAGFTAPVDAARRVLALWHASFPAQVIYGLRRLDEVQAALAKSRAEWNGTGDGNAVAPEHRDALRDLGTAYLNIATIFRELHDEAPWHAFFVKPRLRRLATDFEDFGDAILMSVDEATLAYVEGRLQQSDSTSGDASDWRRQLASL